MLPADEDGLGVDKIEDGLREILIGPDFLRQMLGLYRLAVIHVDGKLAVCVHPLLRHAFELAGDGVLGDLDTGHGH